MKKWLTLSLALVAAAVTQAVTVAWTVPNSDYNFGNWATDTDGNLNINVYFVYSATKLTVEGAHDLATSTAVGNGTVAYGVSTVVDNVETGNGNSTLQAFYGSGLNPQPTGTLGNSVTSDGDCYYYMVVVSTVEDATKGQYAVAGTGPVTITNNVVSDDSAGIYANPAGTIPSEAEYYVSPGEWMGGTLKNALVPEPTVLALLALGVAGVALRRKKNFTK